MKRVNFFLNGEIDILINIERMEKKYKKYSTHTSEKSTYRTLSNPTFISVFFEFLCIHNHKSKPYDISGHTVKNNIKNVNILIIIKIFDFFLHSFDNN
jgi:hypothetical protein